MHAITSRANAIIGAVTQQRNDALNRCAELTADLMATRAQSDEFARSMAEKDARIAELQRVAAAMVAAQAKPEPVRSMIADATDELQAAAGSFDMGGLED